MVQTINILGATAFISTVVFSYPLNGYSEESSNLDVENKTENNQYSEGSLSEPVDTASTFDFDHDHKHFDLDDMIIKAIKDAIHDHHLKVRDETSALDSTTEADTASTFDFDHDHKHFDLDDMIIKAIKDHLFDHDSKSHMLML